MNTEPQEKAIAAFIKGTRRKHGWSQKELAARAGCEQCQISNIETGKWIPTLPTLFKLLQALDSEINLISATKYNPFKKEFIHE